MRVAVFAVVLTLAGCASSPQNAPPSSAVTSTGTWAFAFDAGPGLASATLSGADGKPDLRVTCEAPRGDLMVTDWTFTRARHGDTQATVSIGSATKTVPARVGGDGAGRQALTFSLPPRDPLFQTLYPNAAVRTAASGYTHNWAAGAASRLNDVINSCRTLGS
jgi:hypothetical protein